MDAPKCRTCGERHRLGPCAHGPQFMTKSRGGGESGPAPKGGQTPSGPRELKRKRAPKGSFDRQVYQRDLMRKRRAEGKA